MQVLCAACGKMHDEDEMELVFRRPDCIAALPADERSRRTREESDLCALWGDSGEAHRYFVRGIIPFAVRDREKNYAIGAWAEVSGAAFHHLLDLWENEAQAREPAIPGRLANTVPLHEFASEGLDLALHLTGPKTRPEFRLAPGHTLSDEQAEGISAHRAAEYTDLLRPK